MSVTAETATGESIEKLETMVAGCPAFQLAARVSTAHAAKAFIHYPEYVPAGRSSECMPFAVIVPVDSRTELISAGGKNDFVVGGTLELQLCLEIDDTTDIKGQFIRFLNFEEAVWRYCLDLAAVSDNLAIVDMPCNERVQTKPQAMAEHMAQRPFFKATYQVTWGNVS